MTVDSTHPDYPFLAGGGEMGLLTRSYDWSQTPIGSPDQWTQSLRTLVNMMLTSRFPMLIFWGPKLVTFYNDAFRPSLGDNGKHPSSLGQPGEQSWAESWPVIGPMIYSIMAGGDAVWFEDQKLPLYRNGQMGFAYWTYSFSPLQDDDGAVNGILVTCSETTQAVLGRQKTEEVQREVLAFFEQSPVALAIIDQENLTFRMANAFYGHLVGRMPDQLVGKSLLDALPELAGQGFDQLLRDVISTGQPFIANELLVKVVRNNQLESIYVDLTYQPRREADQTISGIFVIATDVTQQVRARQLIEQQAAQLRQLLENTPDVITRWDTNLKLVYANSAFNSKVGIGDEGLLGKNNLEIGQPVEVAVPYMNSLKTVVDSGLPHQHYNSLDTPGGTVHYYSRMVPEFDSAGQLVSVLAIARDISRLKMLETELEQKVIQRTEELVVANKDLMRSNDNLQQFAYVASHDLQEPLRKIQSFSTLLSDHHGLALGDSGKDILRRISAASTRMSTLIKDLLAYSRISTRQQVFDLVSLQSIMDSVLITLEWTIEQSGAQLTIADLPVVKGDKTQLSQLFQNLISNAIKFTPAYQTPQLDIRCQQLTIDQLPDDVRPAGTAMRFYQISFTDQGIGFDQQYRDRIFQVFQRLHGRSEFDGTGVGLAICQRVAENHGGAISATGEQGRGATFDVYLPA